MSFFDPQKLYYHGNRYTNSGQILRKRPIKHNYALTDKDKDKAIKILENYDYYISPTPPIEKSLHSYSDLYSFQSTVDVQNQSFLWTQLNDFVSNITILQEAPPGSSFNLYISLIDISFRIGIGVGSNTMTFTSDYFDFERSVSRNSFYSISPYSSTRVKTVYADEYTNFIYSNNVTVSPLEEGSDGVLSKILYYDIDLFRAQGLPSSLVFSISNSDSTSYVDQVNATFNISINAIY